MMVRRQLILAARLRWFVFGVSFSGLFLIWGLKLAGVLSFAN
jgi:hypothetical protein